MASLRAKNKCQEPPQKIRRPAGATTRQKTPETLARGLRGDAGIRHPALGERKRHNEQLQAVAIDAALAQQVVGGLATCILAGSCLQEVVSEPDVGVLLYAGHVDMLSAKVCTLQGLADDGTAAGAAEAPALAESAEAGSDIGKGLRAFLQKGSSRKKNEASCLSSGSYDEEGSRRPPGRTVTPMDTGKDAGRGASGLESESESSQGKDLASLELEEEEERGSGRILVRQNSLKRRRGGSPNRGGDLVAGSLLLAAEG
mmetsp:Transcript_24197/g.67288  ORF Transcript_24197/g.67288 Transcript_24197/m.67288 type:complete len:258 (+) Transcript_24197:314-1087(+)|eukprot:CAMPEP_0117661860 /NCGR_PEP_ID=MMETSP0804-20121206/7758_1 /TAXON_ID=1074897 /ORGANISM="Tetraselmis astigmatica, Strain CCMP880" /LENGTH=257 /DNA_ID=CAMNT_0005468747 /DNA_START=286 /DNA_END=1059 /DNA_ORIENTATION=-